MYFLMLAYDILVQGNFIALLKFIIFKKIFNLKNINKIVKILFDTLRIEMIMMS